MYRPPPYKSVNNQFYTLPLFYEEWVKLAECNKNCDPIFSLQKDVPGMINSRTTFIRIGDPTGYKWAVKYLGDHAHWIKLMNCPWFVRAYETWKKELNLKLQADAIQRIVEISNSDNPSQALAAAKYVAEEGWSRQTKGRPSKTMVDQELKRLTEEASNELDDMQRIGLKVIK